MASVKNSILIYACAFAVAAATPFALLPVLTRQLSPQQFGEVTSFLIVTALLANLAGLSAHGFISVRYFKSTAEQFRNIVSSTLGVVCAVHLLAGIAIFLLHRVLIRAFDLPGSYWIWAVVAALFVNLNLIFLSIFQASGKPWLYLRARVIQGLLELGPCIALLFLVFHDASARAYSYVIAIAASGAVGLHYCWRTGKLGSNIDPQYIKQVARFGLPLVPHIAAGSGITYVDRIVVSTLLGADDLGIYMAGMQIGMAMIVLIEPLNKALAPWLFKELSAPDTSVRSGIVKKTYALYFVLFIVGALLVVVSNLLFDELVGAKFSAAKQVIQYMVFGFVFQGMYYSVVNYLFYAEKTARLSVMSGTAACVGCGISYWLTSRFGLRGAGLSFVFNNALLFLLVWFVAAKTVPMPWFGSLRQHA